MNHRYSLAHLTVLPMTPPDMVDVAAAAGYDFVGLRATRVTHDEPLYDLAHDRALMRATKARLAATGLSVLDLELFRMDPATDPSAFAPVLDAAAELGARNIIAQLPDPEFTRKTERFARLCDMAAPLGIFVSLEFPHWTETGTLDEAARVLRSAARGNGGMLIDMLHMCRSRSSQDELRALPREWFRFAHLCDASAEIPPTLAGIIRTAREERLFPGEGECAVRETLACMPSDIPYALEIPRATLRRAVGPAELARLALVVTRSHLEDEAAHPHGTTAQPVGDHGRPALHA